MSNVAGGGESNFRVVRAGEMQELLDLVRGDVGEDAAVGRGVEEPVGARGGVQAVRAEARDVDDAADGSGLDQPGGGSGRRHLEPLREIDGPDAPGFRDCLAQAAQFVAGQAAGLVDHHVLAVAHGGDGKLGAAIGASGDEHEVDGVVPQNRL